MNPVKYIQEALRPGGTPQRFLFWSALCLVGQSVSCLLPGILKGPDSASAGLVLLGFSAAVGLSTLFVRGTRSQLAYAEAILFLGIASVPLWLYLGVAPQGAMIYLMSWCMVTVLAHRREYCTFPRLVVVMVSVLVLYIVSLLVDAPFNLQANTWAIIGGSLMILITNYLQYIDHAGQQEPYKREKNIMADMSILSQKLSRILTSKGELEQVLWQVSMECIPLLGMEDCVIYLYDEKADKLVQMAAYGPKTGQDRTIVNQIEIAPGQGVVGACFEKGKPMVIHETALYKDYIVDDEDRQSELAVPIVSNGKVIGVIDSEHTMKGFFKERHLRAFQLIASFCGVKITEYRAQDTIRQAQEARQEAERMKELDELKNRFITNISHDLKTPLSLIKAPAMQIAENSADESMRKQSQYILKNTEHLTRVVNQLLQLNRVDRGLNELYLEEVNLEELFDKIETQYRGLAEREGIHFSIQSCPRKVVTDSFRLEQIIHNLTHNAFRYAGKGGRISVVCHSTDDMVHIAVSDDGPGISKEMQTRVFDRFFKVDINNHEGTGIGLSLVREYVQSLQGEISLDSQEGVGSTFHVHVPVSLASEPELSHEELLENAHEEENKPILLVVEDHPDLNDFICTSMESDYHCVSAFDGQEALEVMESTTPDIIISDLMMPRMDGTAFITRVKNSDRFGHIPVVVLSAKTQTESKVELYNTGADNYLVKPFEIKELKAVVENVLSQRKKLSERFRNSYLSNDQEPEIMEDPNVIEETPTLVSRAVTLVKENIDDSTLKVNTLAEKLGMGRNRFQKEIKDLTGLTPVEFVRSIRLYEAMNMLADDPGLHVSEVAYSVGFNNLSYFTRSFKAEFGMLPSEWSTTAEERVGS